MNCRDYQLQITLQSYGEIENPERASLERHLLECGDCASARDGQHALDRFLAEEEIEVLPADFLAESRRSLANELDRIESRRSWWRMPAFSVVFTPMRLLESAALVAMGLALGVYVGRQGTPDAAVAAVSSPSIPSDATVNLKIVKSDPVSGMVELAGEVIQPLRRQGNINDREVRQLLFGALQDVSNPGGVRLNALEVLSQQSSDQAVQEGLIYALTHDPVPQVRMKALESLKAYAAQESVQRALAYVLVNDDISGIRKGAIDALGSVSQAADVAKTIQEVGRDDENAYIRMKSRDAGMRLVGSKE